MQEMVNNRKYKEKIKKEFQFDESEFEFENSLESGRILRKQSLWFALRQKPLHYSVSLGVVVSIVAILFFAINAYMGEYSMMVFLKAFIFLGASWSLIFLFYWYRWSQNSPEWELKFLAHCAQLRLDEIGIIRKQLKKMNEDKAKLRRKMRKKEIQMTIIQVNEAVKRGVDFEQLTRKERSKVKQETPHK